MKYLQEEQIFKKISHLQQFQIFPKQKVILCRNLRVLMQISPSRKDLQTDMRMMKKMRMILIKELIKKIITAAVYANE